MRNQKTSTGRRTVKGTQNTTIVLLLITASILTAMLISPYIGGEPAAYADASVRQGKYIMATGAFDKNIDLLYVVNIQTQKLIVYAPNKPRRTLDVQGKAISLGKFFGRKLLATDEHR